MLIEWVMVDDADNGQHKLSIEFFRQLPKTDLHVHLDGSLRLETILDLAREHKVELPSTDPAELRRAMNLGQNCGSLVEYLKAFDVTLRVMQHEEALFRAAYELAEDAARENVRYMEVRYSPMLHTRLGLKLTSVVEAVLAGLRAAHDNLGVESAVILCGIRNISPESSLEMAELAVAYKGRGVVGFDLAGAEYDHPAKHHKKAFQLVRDNNINTTIHAGEAYGPESIAQALHVCGAHRIGHGCRLREDGDLLHYINDHRIPLECCPSSNVQTGAVRDLGLAPAQALLRPRAPRDHQHRQPAGHRHHRLAGALVLPHADGDEPARHQDDDRRRLQERVPPLPRQAGVPPPRDRGARALHARRADQAHAAADQRPDVRRLRRAPLRRPGHARPLPRQRRKLT